MILTSGRHVILEQLYENGMIHFWPKDNPKGWILHSGKWSPFYINLRGISSKPRSHQLLADVGKALGTLIRKQSPRVNRVVGIATAGIPLAVATTMISRIPSSYTRKIDGLSSLGNFDEIMGKLVKEYGEPTVVEGAMSDGDHIMLVDDLITDGETKLIAKKLVEYQAKINKIAITCNDVAVVVDREQGGGEELTRNGLRLHSLIRFKSDALEGLSKKIGQKNADVIQEYLKDDSKFQDEAYREKIRLELNKV